MARNPLEAKTVAENCLKWGTGGINIDESRVGTEQTITRGRSSGGTYDIGINKLELAGQKILKEIGIEFQEQVLMFNKFLVDVLIPSKNIIIQRIVR